MRTTLLSTNALLLLLIAAQGGAQVPAASLDLLVGTGPHNPYHGGGVYESKHEPTARVAATLRLGTRSRTRPVFKAEYVLTPASDEITLTGNSYPHAFPATRGAGFALGVQHRTSSSAIVGVAVGRGRYGGTTFDSRYNAVFLEGEAALPIGAHASFMINAQYKRWVTRNARHWFAPITIGLRVQ